MSGSLIADIVDGIADGIDQSVLPSLPVLENIVMNCLATNAYANSNSIAGKDFAAIKEIIMKLYFILQIIGEKDLTQDISIEDVEWVLKALQEYPSQDIALLQHQDILDLLSTRILLEDTQPVPARMSHLLSVQHNLERLNARFATSYNEELVREELKDNQQCKDALLKGLTRFVNQHLKMAGSLPSQAEMALSSGDFDTVFLVLGDEIKRLEKKLRISAEKSRASDELEIFLVRLQEMQVEEALKVVEWHQELYKQTLAYRKSLNTNSSSEAETEESLVPAKKSAPTQRPTRAARRRMSSLAMFLNSTENTADETDPSTSDPSNATQDLALAARNAWLKEIEAEIKERTDSLSNVCEQQALLVARQLELDNVEWYTKHVNRRAVVRSKLDKSRTILADRFVANIKEIRDKHASILLKAREVYIGGIQAQRQAEKIARERLENPGSVPADDPYSLSQASAAARKRNAKSLNLVFCKEAILNALDKLQISQMRQFDESLEQSAQLPVLVEEIRKDVELFSAQYTERVRGLHSEASQRYETALRQTDELELKLFRETSIGRRPIEKSSAGSTGVAVSTFGTSVRPMSHKATSKRPDL